MASRSAALSGHNATPRPSRGERPPRVGESRNVNACETSVTPVCRSSRRNATKCLRARCSRWLRVARRARVVASVCVAEAPVRIAQGQRRTQRNAGRRVGWAEGALLWWWWQVAALARRPAARCQRRYITLSLSVTRRQRGCRQAYRCSQQCASRSVVHVVQFTFKTLKRSTVTRSSCAVPGSS